MNPIISMMNQQNPMMQMLQPIYNALRGASSPMEALGRMAMNDNRMQQVVNAVNQSGSIQQAVYTEAQKRNVNPNDALNQARQILQSFNMR